MAIQSYYPTQQNNNCFFGTQIFLRILTIAATFAATWLIFTSKETVVIFGIQVDARYSYSSAFKFFAYANSAACGFSVLSLLVVFCLTPWAYFYMFLHDLVISTLLMAGCAAATAIGFVGKYGNSHTGWMAICDNFAKYCDKVTHSVIFSYVAVVLYLILTIMSANKSRNTQDK